MPQMEMELFIPAGVMRRWPVVEAELRPLASLRMAPVDTAKMFAPSVGYVPVYASLEALIAEHGDVPYQVMRRSR